ncbi:hypothetical protein ACJ41O_000203 [Fusarium nematophilum]
MSQAEELVPYHTVTRDIYAPIGQVWGILGGFGAEKAWYPGCIRLSLEGFGIGSIRTFSYEYPAGPHTGERYEFSEEMTEVDAANYSISFRVRRPDYPDMVAFGTTALEYIGPNKTRFIWRAKGVHSRRNTRKSWLRTWNCAFPVLSRPSQSKWNKRTWAN